MPKKPEIKNSTKKSSQFRIQCDRQILVTANDAAANIHAMGRPASNMALLAVVRVVESWVRQAT
jgi:hypothetical protein